MVNLLFSEMCKPSKALLCTGHPPARVRRILVLQKSQLVGRILESDTCSQNKARTSLWPLAKRRIQESDLRRWCCRTAFYFVIDTAINY